MTNAAAAASVSAGSPTREPAGHGGRLAQDDEQEIAAEQGSHDPGPERGRTGQRIGQERRGRERHDESDEGDPRVAAADRHQCPGDGRDRGDGEQPAHGVAAWTPG